MSTKHAILALLDRRPMYGYELKKEFEIEIGKHWSLNFGQIYLTLESMEKQGLVTHRRMVGRDAPDRKVFRITKKGRDSLIAWFNSPIEPVKGLKDEFYVKLMLSLTSALIDVEDIVLSQKRFVLQKLHEYTNLKRLADPIVELPRILLLDLALLRTEADIRWLEMCGARLEKLKKEKLAVGRSVLNQTLGNEAEAKKRKPEPVGAKEE